MKIDNIIKVAKKINTLTSDLALAK